MKVLIVEDSGLIRRVIAKVATEQGYDTIEAGNGADGLAKLRKHGREIHLVVLDWNMPVMDGYEVLTKIRSAQEYDHVAVLMATSDGIEEDVIKALKAGADGYLVKPFTEETLSGRMEELLNAPKNVRQRPCLKPANDR